MIDLSVRNRRRWPHSFSFTNTFTKRAIKSLCFVRLVAKYICKNMKSHVRETETNEKVSEYSDTSPNLRHFHRIHFMNANTTKYMRDYRAKTEEELNGTKTYPKPCDGGVYRSLCRTYASNPRNRQEVPALVFGIL